MAYASSIQVAGVHFNGGQESAIIVKRNGNALLGDVSGQLSTGNVDYKIRVNSGFAQIVDDNLTVSISDVDCGPKAGFVTDSTGKMYCMTKFEELTLTGNLNLSSNNILNVNYLSGDDDDLNLMEFRSSDIIFKSNNGAGGTQDRLRIVENGGDFEFTNGDLDLNSNTIKNVNVLASTEIQNSGTATSGGVICVKVDGRFGQCSDQPGASGTCTCS